MALDEDPSILSPERLRTNKVKEARQFHDLATHESDFQTTSTGNSSYPTDQVLTATIGLSYAMKRAKAFFRELSTDIFGLYEAVLKPVKDDEEAEIE